MKWRYLLGAFLHATEVILMATSPLLTYEYLSYVETLSFVDAPLWYGICLIFGFVGLLLIMLFIEVTFYNIIINTQLNIRSSVVSSVYEKCQKIREIENIGETVNYINIDCKRLEDFFLYSTDIIYCIVTSVMYILYIINIFVFSLNFS